MNFGDNLLNKLLYGAEESTSSMNDEILKCSKKFLYGTNVTRTHNHLVRKQMLNHFANLAHLAKWLSADTFGEVVEWLFTNWVVVDSNSATVT